MSCVQIYNDALDPAQIHLNKKRCQDMDSVPTESFCPSEYDYFDDMCYKVG